MKSSLSYTLSIHSSLSNTLIEQVESLDQLCFRDKFSPTDKQHTDRHDRFCSSDDLLYYILATENNTIIGETRVFARTITFENKKVLLGGIGSVATHPTKRNQKVATAMLARAMELLQKEKCDIAYLCADIYTEKALLFYEQFGFTLLPKPHTYLGKSGKRYTDSDGMLGPIQSQEIFQQILASSISFDIGIGNW